MNSVTQRKRAKRGEAGSSFPKLKPVKVDIALHNALDHLREPLGCDLGEVLLHPGVVSIICRLLKQAEFPERYADALRAASRSAGVPDTLGS